MKNVPPSGVRTPDSIFARVDLPLPFSPTMAWTSPGCIVRLHLLRAIVSPNRFEISRTTIAFSDIGRLPWRHDEPIKAVPRRWLDNERGPASAADLTYHGFHVKGSVGRSTIASAIDAGNHSSG